MFEFKNGTRHLSYSLTLPAIVVDRSEIKTPVQPAPPTRYPPTQNPRPCILPQAAPRSTSNADTATPPATLSSREGQSCILFSPKACKPVRRGNGTSENSFSNQAPSRAAKVHPAANHPMRDKSPIRGFSICLIVGTIGYPA